MSVTATATAIGARAAATSPPASSTNTVMLTLCMLAAALAILVLGLVLFFLMSKGLHYMSWHLFTRVPNNVELRPGRHPAVHLRHPDAARAGLGHRPAAGHPRRHLSVGAKGRFASIVRFFTDVLNGIPSIVIGIFAYAAVVVPCAQAHPGQPAYTAYAGGFALGIMMVPTVMRTTEEILRLVPFSLREASLGLGATRWRTMWSVVLPAARGGVITGIMLALARIAGRDRPAAVHHPRQRVLRDAQGRRARPCRP